MKLWSLPVTATIGDREYDLHTDYRDILEIFSYLDEPDLPDFVRWAVALALFYEQPVPEQDYVPAAQYLVWFLTGGVQEGRPGPRLLDWQQDAGAIIADVNRVAGCEIRSQPYVHWWTFLSWFHAIGQGQLSALVSLRDKLSRGKKLEPWEKAFYRENKSRVELKKKYSSRELQEQERLLQLLAP